MDKQTNDKWLDELISRTINAQRPEFDDEKWKQKFPDEFQTLQSRAKVPAHSIRWISFLRSPVVKFAAAAVIIVAIGLFMIHPVANKKVEITKEANVTKSPAEMLTRKSLMIAYRKGGIEAVETQCDKAMARLAAPSEIITIDQLLAELDNI